MSRRRCRQRVSNLTDAFVDDSIGRELFLEKKNSFLLEEQRIKERLSKLENGNDDAFVKTRKILEQANQACSSYKKAIGEEKREMVQIITSNLWVEGKICIFKLDYPFELIVNRSLGMVGEPLRDVPRTDFSNLSELIRNIVQFSSGIDIEDHKN